MAKNAKENTFDPVANFDSAPNSMLLRLKTAGTICQRSRATIYRHVKAGELPLVKVGHMSYIRVGDLRRLIQAGKGDVQ